MTTHTDNRYILNAVIEAMWLVLGVASCHVRPRYGIDDQQRIGEKMRTMKQCMTMIADTQAEPASTDVRVCLQYIYIVLVLNLWLPYCQVDYVANYLTLFAADSIHTDPGPPAPDAPGPCMTVQPDPGLKSGGRENVLKWQSKTPESGAHTLLFVSARRQNSGHSDYCAVRSSDRLTFSYYSVVTGFWP